MGGRLFAKYYLNGLQVIVFTLYTIIVTNIHQQLLSTNWTEQMDDVNGAVIIRTVCSQNAFLQVKQLVQHLGQ